MSTEPILVSNEELIRNKESRRRALAALPIEEKIKMLVRLQQMASAVGRQAGREYRKPWDIKV